MGDSVTQPGATGKLPALAEVTTRADFGALLTDLRVHSDLSLRELASRVGSNASTLSGWCRAENLPFPAQHAVFRALLETLGVADTDPWMAALARVRDGTSPRRDDGPAPYRGLASYGPDDAGWFFGRSALLDRAHERLTALCADDGRAQVLALVGASGSGKSSLLHAGLIPRLEQAGIACVSLTPGSEPTKRLTTALGAHLDIATDDVLRVLSDTGTGAVDLAVVVDQFEELFTECTDERDRDQLLCALTALAGPGGRCAVVIGLRIDFYADLVATGRLVDSLQDAQVLVGPMSSQELTSAIVEPARRAGWSVDDELVALLLRDFVPAGSLEGRHDAGALPLLSHALLETWARARRGRLTVAAYHAAGGMQGAVEQSAERVFTDLPPDGQALARQLFLRLVHLGDRAVVTRRAASYHELDGLAAATHGGNTDGDSRTGADRSAVAAVLEPFVAARLLTAHETAVEIAHESLLAAWPRLRSWVEEDRDGLRAHRTVVEATRIWTDSDRDPSTLATGARLEGMQELATSESPTLRLNEQERAYVTASSAAAAAAAAAARRRTVRLRSLVAVATVCALLASSLALVASRSRADAVAARDEAMSRQIALTAERLRATDPALAAQLAVAGYQVAPTSEARAALLDTAAAPTSTRTLGGAGPTALAVSHRGRLTAVSNATDGTVQLLDGGDRAGLLAPGGPDREVYALALTPDDAVLAVGDTGPEVGLWDVSDPHDPQRLGDPVQGPTGPIQGLAISPDGAELAAVGLGDGVFRWDLSDPAAPRELPLLPAEAITWSVAYSPDGTHLAVGDELGEVHVWDLDGDPTPVTKVALADRDVNAVAYSPDATMLAAGSRTGALGVWDLAEPHDPQPLELADAEFGSWVNTATFSPDGRYLAAGSSDLDLRVWDTDTWAVTRTLPHPAAVTQAAFTGDSSAIATAATDGTLRVWDRSAFRPLALSGSVWSIQFTPDGDRMAAFSGVDTRVWELSDPAVPAPRGDPLLAPRDGPSFTGAGAMSPDGTLLAHGTLTGEVLLFDVSDPGDPTMVGRPLGGSSELVEAVAFSADGSLLAAGGTDTAVRVWDLAEPRRPRLAATVEDPGQIVLNLSWHPRDALLAAPSADGLVYLLDLADPDDPVLLATLDGFDSEAYGAAFHPAHEILAAGGSDTTVILWDVTDPAAPHRVGEPLTGPVGRIFDLDFHPSGDALAAAVGDGTTWTWDTRDLEHPTRRAVLGPAGGQTFTVEYSPRGDLLVAAGSDQRLRQWPTDEQALVTTICATAGDPITAEEWATYVPGRPHTPPC